VETIIFNISSPQVRTDFLEGREYYVVPMTMMVEGVLNGSEGPLYYPADEMKKVPSCWDHKPIVVNHPTLNGASISACDPVILESRKVGIILNTQFVSTGKLKSEAWLEKAKLKKVDNRILERIEAGQAVEVSTGLYTENHKTEGEFNGKPYVGVAKNYRPDHLAILPDTKGACSIEDGAGLLVNSARYNTKQLRRMVRKGLAMADGSLPIANEADLVSAIGMVNNVRYPAEGKIFISKRAKELGKSNLIPDDWKIIANSDMAFGDIASGIQDQLAAKHGKPGKRWDGFIEEIYPSHVVYHSYEGTSSRMLMCDYEVSEGKVKLKGEPSPAKRVISYEKEATPTKNERAGMTKEERVKAVITANVGWTDGEKDFLMTLPDDKLEKMANPVVVVNQTPNPAPVVPVTQPVVPVVNQGANQPAPAITMDQYVANAPAEFREVLNGALNNLRHQKATLVANILANKQNRFTKEYLETQSVEVLQNIAALAPAPVQNQHGVPITQAGAPNYFGAAGPIINAGGSQFDDEPLKTTPLFSK
jgi:hypothetical protein